MIMNFFGFSEFRADNLEPICAIFNVFLDILVQAHHHRVTWRLLRNTHRNGRDHSASIQGSAASPHSFPMRRDLLSSHGVEPI